MASQKETGHLVPHSTGPRGSRPRIWAALLSLWDSVSCPGGPGTAQEHGPAHCLLPSDATATISANTLKVRSPAARQARTAN